jgi:hypothetical protein
MGRLQSVYGENEVHVALCLPQAVSIRSVPEDHMTQSQLVKL